MRKVLTEMLNKLELSGSESAWVILDIKPIDPTFSTEHAKVKDSRFWPHFKGAIGAIDGSHIPVSVPEEELVNHTCRHGYTSQNVLAICDFDMRFTFVVAGWPGSAHDTRILNHALAKFADQFPVPPTGRKLSYVLQYVASVIIFLILTCIFLGKYYLVDSGYPNRTGYLAPFKGSTYHLPEFRIRRQRAPQGKFEIFNFLHSSLRNVIEHAFGVLKQKWRILKAMPSFPPRRQKHIFIACMALHNFIRDSKLEDEDYMPEAAQATTQAQGDDVPEEENEVTMNTIRDMIANALFIARAT